MKQSLGRGEGDGYMYNNHKERDDYDNSFKLEKKKKKWKQIVQTGRARFKSGVIKMEPPHAKNNKVTRVGRCKTVEGLRG